MYMYYNAIRKPYLHIMGNLWIHTSCCVHCDTIVFNLFWTFNIIIMIHVHTYTYNVRLHAHVTTGNRTYVGYVYTEITINNAIVRVFVKIMQDVVDCKKTSFPRGRGGAHLRLCSQSPTTPDYSSDACDDGEFVMLHMYSIHTVSSAPGKCTQAWALRSARAGAYTCIPGICTWKLSANIGLSPATNPKPKGTTIPLPAQANPPISFIPCTCLWIGYIHMEAAPLVPWNMVLG